MKYNRSRSSQYKYRSRSSPYRYRALIDVSVSCDRLKIQNISSQKQVHAIQKPFWTTNSVKLLINEKQIEAKRKLGMTITPHIYREHFKENNQSNGFEHWIRESWNKVQKLPEESKKSPESCLVETSITRIMPCRNFSAGRGQSSVAHRTFISQAWKLTQHIKYENSQNKQASELIILNFLLRITNSEKTNTLSTN